VRLGRRGADGASVRELLPRHGARPERAASRGAGMVPPIDRAGAQPDRGLLGAGAIAPLRRPRRPRPRSMAGRGREQVQSMGRALPGGRRSLVRVWGVVVPLLLALAIQVQSPPPREAPRQIGRDSVRVWFWGDDEAAARRTL